MLLLAGGGVIAGIINTVSTGCFRKFENPRPCLLGIKMIVNHASYQQRRIQFTGAFFCQPCEPRQQVFVTDRFWRCVLHD